MNGPEHYNPGRELVLDRIGGGAEGLHVSDLYLPGYNLDAGDEGRGGDIFNGLQAG